MSDVIDLSDVTICAADTAFVELTARALKISMSGCRFSDAIFFSDVPIEGPFRHVEIAPLASTDAYSLFCLREMVQHIKTPRVLVIQWDGYVINPRAWTNAFRKYDYIGAAWYEQFPPGMPMVGNGGFSLRSLKLLKALQKLPLLPNVQWEDRAICHTYAPRLEREFGIRFAPVKIADRFAYQYRVPKRMPFGFHGVENIWRHVGEEELPTIVETIDVERANPGNTLRLILALAENHRREAARSLYLRFRRRYKPAFIERALGKMVGREIAARAVCKIEDLVADHVV